MKSRDLVPAHHVLGVHCCGTYDDGQACPRFQDPPCVFGNQEVVPSQCVVVDVRFLKVSTVQNDLLVIDLTILDILRAPPLWFPSGR